MLKGPRGFEPQRPSASQLHLGDQPHPLRSSWPLCVRPNTVWLKNPTAVPWLLSPAPGGPQLVDPGGFAPPHPVLQTGALLPELQVQTSIADHAFRPPALGSCYVRPELFGCLGLYPSLASELVPALR